MDSYDKSLQSSITVDQHFRKRTGSLGSPFVCLSVCLFAFGLGEGIGKCIIARCCLSGGAFLSSGEWIAGSRGASVTLRGCFRRLILQAHGQGNAFALLGCFQGADHAKTFLIPIGAEAFEIPSFQSLFGNWGSGCIFLQKGLERRCYRVGSQKD